MNNLEFTLSIPEEKAEVVFEAFANLYGYQLEIDGQPNPETVDMFCKRKVVEFIISKTKEYVLDKARRQAEELANQSIDLSDIK